MITVHGEPLGWEEQERERRENQKRVRAFRRLVAGRIFGATFVKADGSIRRGTFRADAMRKDGSASATYADLGMVTVYEMPQQAYRVIDLDRLVSIRLNGQEVIL